MKTKYPVLLKTSLAIALAACALLTGTMYVFATPSPDKDITLSAQRPQINGSASDNGPIFDKLVDKAFNDGTTPPTAIDYAHKFDVYTHASSENGKSVVTVYTAEQIQHLQANPMNVLKTNEAIYLLDDTMKLFRSFDIVRVTNINCEVETYHGASFYKSDEYYNSFGMVDDAGQTVSYDLKADVFNAMLTRLEALSSASVRYSISGHGNEGFIYLGREDYDEMVLQLESMSIDYYYHNPHNFRLPEESNGSNADQDPFNSLSNNYRSWLSDRDKMRSMNCGVVWFESENIFYVEDLSRANYHDVIKLYPDELFDKTVGNHKYDANDEKVAVIEVWESATKTCVARIRLDNVNNPDEIAQLDALWMGVQANISSAPVDEYATVTDYRVAVYLNGFSGDWGDMAFCYNADGNLDHWSFNTMHETFGYIYLTGTADMAAYVNQILEQMLLP